jgi:hypothetical protein
LHFTHLFELLQAVNHWDYNEESEGAVDESLVKENSADLNADDSQQALP